MYQMYSIVDLYILLRQLSKPVSQIAGFVYSEMCKCWKYLARDLQYEDNLQAKNPELEPK